MIERIGDLYNRRLQSIHQELEKGGFAGVVSRIEELSQEHWYYRLLQGLDERFLGVRPLLSYLAQLDASIPELGVTGAAQEFLNNIGISIVREEDGRKWMREEGVPVLAFGVSHGAAIEPFVMAACLEREDISCIGIKTMEYLGENSTPYLLSVMPRRYAKGRETKGLKDRFDLARTLYRFEKLTEEEIKNLNENALMTAAERLVQGGIVVIFPPGGFKIQSRWRQGIGRVIGNILKLPEANFEEIILAPFHFSGILEKDFYSAARQAWVGKKGKKRSIEVHLGRELTVKELLVEIGSQPTPEQITEFLRVRSIREFIPEANLVLGGGYV